MSLQEMRLRDSIHGPSSSSSSWRNLAIEVCSSLQHLYGRAGAMLSQRFSAKNLMTAIMNMSAPQSVSNASGEVTNRLRDDVQAILSYLEQYIHLWGNFIFAILAIIWMARIDVTVTVYCSYSINPYYHSLSTSQGDLFSGIGLRSVSPTEQSTNFINELFQSILAVKVARTESNVIDHYQKLNDARRKTTLVDNMFKPTPTIN